MRARRRFVRSPFFVPAIFFTLALSGCRNCDLVEAELRSRNNELHSLRSETTRLRWENEALVQELQSVRTNGPGSISPEKASQSYTLHEIKLGRGTGGLDEDHLPGDEALQVVLEPRDGDGHTIKAPGALHVEVQEIAPTGTKVPLSSWDLTQDQLHRTWKSGFWSTGYFVTLPWKNWPSWSRLRVTARLTMTDGRIYEADKDCMIRLTPNAYRHSPPSGEPSPVIIEPAQPLPAPRPVDPNNNSVRPIAAWRASPEPSLADDVHLLRPVPLENPW